jgi:hypothetical protein
VKLSSRGVCGEEGPVEEDLVYRVEVHVPHRLVTSSPFTADMKCFLSDCERSENLSGATPEGPKQTSTNSSHLFKKDP